MRRIRTAFFQAALLVAALAFGAAASEPAGAKEARIVSIGGDVTEIVYRLGAGDALVGRDSTSTWPEAARALPDAGYLRNLGAEGLLSLGPDLVLASAQAGPPVVFDQLAAAGVRVVRVPQEPSFEGLLEKVRVVAAALDREARGDALAQELAASMKAAMLAPGAAPEVSPGVTSGAAVRDDALGGAADRRPRVLFLLNAEGGTLMAAGTGTAADAVLKLAGGANVFAMHERYKPISPEAAVAAAPEVIVMMDHTLAALGGAAGAAAHPVLALTPAAAAGRFVAMDGNYLLSFGPRLPEALGELRAALSQTPDGSGAVN